MAVLDRIIRASTYVGDVVIDLFCGCPTTLVATDQLRRKWARIDLSAGCDTHFPCHVMDVDHTLPRSRGGTDHIDNLQLLCSGCNRSKGGRTMAEWSTAQRVDR